MQLDANERRASLKPPAVETLDAMERPPSPPLTTLVRQRRVSLADANESMQPHSRHADHRFSVPSSQTMATAAYNNGAADRRLSAISMASRRSSLHDWKLPSKREKTTIFGAKRNSMGVVLPSIIVEAADEDDDEAEVEIEGPILERGKFFSSADITKHEAAELPPSSRRRDTVISTRSMALPSRYKPSAQARRHSHHLSVAIAKAEIACG